jgi:hypothetical protein
MKKPLVLLPATVQGIALQARLRKATDVKINFTYIKGVAKQSLARNHYPAGSLLGEAKPAADQCIVEMEATAYELNT